MIPAGRAFFKMSGSGNDFVVIDARAQGAGSLERPEVIRTLAARGTGVGADGVVFLEASDAAHVRIRYFNADGTLASLCGNATLCATRLAVELGAAPAGGLTIETGAGVLGARIDGGIPEIDLAPIREVVERGPIEPVGHERRSGFVRAGVPHVTLLVPDVETVDVVGRGRPIRHDPGLRDGANANFVAPVADGRWRIRTYERGVEAETLACGTGAVASAILLTAWGEARGPVELVTRSGRTLRVRLRRDDSGAWLPSLAGEARVVFRGELAEVLGLSGVTDPDSGKAGA